MFDKLLLFIVAGGGIALAAIFLFPCVAQAQLLVREVPSDQRSQPAVEYTNVEAVDADPLPVSDASGAGAGSIDDEQGERLIREYRLKAGPVGPRKLFSASKIDPHVGVGEIYDDNILTSSGNHKQSDFITRLAGGLTVSLGDFVNRTGSFLIADYTGTGELFARHGEENAFDQDASLIACYRPHDLMVRFTSLFQLTHEANADIGQRVGQTVYGDSLIVRFFRNDYTTLEGAVDFSYRDYADISSNSEVAASAGIDYRVTNKLQLGPGIVVGRLEASDDLEEYFEAAQLRLGYDVTDKISLTLRAGVEVRERGSGAGTSVDPVFQLTGAWTPNGGTTLKFEGHRRTEASASIRGDDFISTAIQLTLRQRVYKRFYAEVAAGYENADYERVGAGSTSSRNDDFFTLHAAAGYDFVEWAKLEAFYAYRNNRSTEASHEFASNRFGLSASLFY